MDGCSVSAHIRDATLTGLNHFASPPPGATRKWGSGPSRRTSCEVHQSEVQGRREGHRLYGCARLRPRCAMPALRQGHDQGGTAGRAQNGSKEWPEGRVKSRAACAAKLARPNARRTRTGVAATRAAPVAVIVRLREGSGDEGCCASRFVASPGASLRLPRMRWRLPLNSPCLKLFLPHTSRPT